VLGGMGKVKLPSWIILKIKALGVEDVEKFICDVLEQALQK